MRMVNTAPPRKKIGWPAGERIGCSTTMHYTFFWKKKKKNKQNVRKQRTDIPAPRGASRVAVFALPAYVDGYSITIRSKVQDLVIKFNTFSPTVVFLDSLFRPTHELSEKQFFIKHLNKLLAIPELIGIPCRFLNFETEAVMQKEWQMDRYMLIYTNDSNERLTTYNDQGITRLINHPVMRSAVGELTIKLPLK